MPIELRSTPGGLQVSTPYDAAFLADFKARVPAASRSWQKPYWVIDARYGKETADLIERYFGVHVSVPQATLAATEVRSFELRYLGRCKERGIGEPASAYGTTDGLSWAFVFPEPVLRAWFGATEQTETATFYVTLGIPTAAAPEEIKRAYRRMARQWHPDVCREPDATQRFQAIQRAYSVLADPLSRRKYDAGLLLEKSTKRQPSPYYAEEYRAPLRCGHLLVEGTPKVGRFLVSHIVAWEDVVRDGKTMVSSWDTGSEAVRIEWV